MKKAITKNQVTRDFPAHEKSPQCRRTGVKKKTRGGSAGITEKEQSSPQLKTMFKPGIGKKSVKRRRKDTKENRVQDGGRGEGWGKGKLN